MTAKANTTGNGNGALMKWLLGIFSAVLLFLGGTAVANRVQLSALENDRQWIREELREMKALLREIDRRLRTFETRK